MPFVRLYLDLIREAFSGVRPWFRIFIWKSLELWSDLFSWEQWGEEKGTRLGLVVIVDVRLSWSSLPIIVCAGTVLLWTGIYSAKHEVWLTVWLRRHVTQLISVALLMIVLQLPLDGLRLRVMSVFGAASDVLPLCSLGGALVSHRGGGGGLAVECVVWQ